MRGYRKPFSVPTRPDISIAAVPLLAVSGGVAGACMDDRSISQNAHFDFLRSEAADHHRPRRLYKKLVFVDERSVGVRALEIFGQDLVKPSDIAVLYRMDVFAVERGQRINVAVGCSVCLHVCSLGFRGSRSDWALPRESCRRSLGCILPHPTTSFAFGSPRAWAACRLVAVRRNLRLPLRAPS